MLDPYLLYQFPMWLVFVLFLALLLIPMELGYRLGRRRRGKNADREGVSRRGDVALTSMLALLGLVLAFTYSFSLSRSDLRKVAEINEVNALGTAYLRADLLAEPGRTAVRELLYKYAKSRYVAPGTVKTHADFENVVNRSVEIQSKSGLL